MNLSQGVKVTRVMAAVAAGTDDATNGTVIDMANFEGVLFIAAFGALTATAVTTLKAQQGQAANLSDAADLLGSAISIADDKDGKCLVLDIFQPAERYLRPVITRATANAVIDGVFAIQYGPRVQPTVHDTTTVVTAETHVSPAEGTA